MVDQSYKKIVLGNVLKNSISVFAIQITSRVLSFFSFVYIARLLGIEEIGNYAFILSLCSLLTLFVEFGTNQFLVKKVASGNALPVSNDIRNIILLKIVQFFIGFSLLLVLEYDTLVSNFNILNLTICYVVFEGIAQTGISILNGRKQFIRANIFTFFYETGRSFALLAFLFISGDIRVVPAVYILAAFLYAVVIAAAVLKKELDAQSRGNSGWLRALLFYYRNTYLFFLSAIAYQLYFRIDMILLKRLSSAYELGVYGTAFKFFEVFLFVPAVLSGIIFPSVVSLFHRNEISQLTGYLKDFQLKAVMMISSIVLVLILGSDLIISVFFGETYKDAVMIMQLLFMTSFLYGFNLIYPVLLNATGNEKYTMVVFLAGFVINLSLNAYFLPLYGAKAAAIINFISELVVTVLYYEFLKRKSLNVLNVKAFWFIILCLVLSTIRIFLVDRLELIWLSLLVFSGFVFFVLCFYRKEISPKLLLHVRQ